MNWSHALKEIRAKKLELARMDPQRGMPLRPPPGASQHSIANVERRLGRPLPSSYRAFLAEHDGFPQLYQSTSLLGAGHLARGTYVDLARMVLAECEAPAADWTPLSRRARKVRELIPFAIDLHGDTIVAWDPSTEHGDEMEVVLWMNEIGERLPSFEAFLVFVLDMLRADIAELAARAARSAPKPAEVLRGRVAARSHESDHVAPARSGPRPPMTSYFGAHG
jgi:hypothetical protein